MKFKNKYVERAYKYWVQARFDDELNIFTEHALAKVLNIPLKEMTIAFLYRFDKEMDCYHPASDRVRKLEEEAYEYVNNH